MNEKFEQECDRLTCEKVNKSTTKVSGDDQRGMHTTSRVSGPKAPLAGPPVSFTPASG